MKHILILGGAGKTGGLLTRMALEAGLYVTVLVRNPASITIANDHLEVIEGDVLNYMDIEKVVQGQDAVLSTLVKDCESLEVLTLGTKKIIRAMEKEKVYRFIALSSIGAGSTKEKVGWPFRLMLKITGRHNFFEALANLESQLLKSQLNYTLIQAGVLSSYGQQRMALQIKLPAQVKMTLLSLGKKAGRSQVAAYMLNELLNPSWIKEIICVQH